MLSKWLIDSTKCMFRWIKNLAGQIRQNSRLKTAIDSTKRWCIAAVNWLVNTMTRLITSDASKRRITTIKRWIVAIATWLIISVSGVMKATLELVTSYASSDRVNRAKCWFSNALCKIRKSPIAQSCILTLKKLYGHIVSKANRQKLTFVGSAILVITLVFWISKPSEPQAPDLPPIAESPSTSKVAPKIAGKPANKVREPFQLKKFRNSSTPNFSEFAAGAERKGAFFGYFLPLIEKENIALQKTRQYLQTWNQNRTSIDDSKERRIRKIAASYRIREFDVSKDSHWNSLLHRINIIPPSLALAQAANESAWGTSRFAREANNYYGQWCFKIGCGVIPARREANKTHEVAAFDSPKESVEMYIHNLNTNGAYQSLRDIREQLDVEQKPITGLALAAGLGKYSERGGDYVSELRSMIKFNKLGRFDAS